MTGLGKRLAYVLIERLTAGNKILVCGNGGSAAQAMHFAAELISRFETERKSLPCICLNTDTAIITAIGNDYGFDKVFSRQVEGLGKPGDVLLLITTSGNTTNLAQAEVAARAIGVITVALSGRDGGLLQAEHSLIADGKTTAEIQEHHLSILHEVCRLIDDTFTVYG